MKFRKGLMVLGGLLLALAASGCGGITASPSISPASFFLPGLMKNDAPKPERTPDEKPPAVAQTGVLPNS